MRSSPGDSDTEIIGIILPLTPPGPVSSPLSASGCRALGFPAAWILLPSPGNYPSAVLPF